DGSSTKTNLESAFDDTRDFVAARARLNANAENDGMGSRTFRNFQIGYRIHDCTEPTTSCRERRRVQFQCELPWRLLRWRLRNHETCPWKERAVRIATAFPNRHLTRAICGSMDAPVVCLRDTAECTLGQQSADWKVEECVPPAAANSRFRLRFLILRPRCELR